MTEIAFHFNVQDRIAYACRLLRKAYRSAAQVGVVGEAALLELQGRYHELKEQLARAQAELADERRRAARLEVELEMKSAA